jgi:hypothetical protein
MSRADAGAQLDAKEHPTGAGCTDASSTATRSGRRLTVLAASFDDACDAQLVIAAATAKSAHARVRMRGVARPLRRHRSMPAALLFPCPEL